MIALIVAMDTQQLIGKDNAMPWHYPEDLAYFKTITAQHPLLMGRKTFESILSYGGPLRGRHHYVLTRQSEGLRAFENVTYIHDATTLIEKYRNDDDTLFLIGGASLYQQYLLEAKRLYLTLIDEMYEGDTYFPVIRWEDYELISSESRGALTFNVFEKR